MQHGVSLDFSHRGTIFCGCFFHAFKVMFYIVVVVHARILYGTNAQETKITLFGDGGDKLVGCFRRGIAVAKNREFVAKFPSLG